MNENDSSVQQSVQLYGLLQVHVIQHVIYRI